MSGKAIPSNGAVVTPSNDAYIGPGSLFVGTQGDVCVLLADQPESNDPNDGIIFKEVVGDFPRLVKKVFATNTTATDIVIDL